jgi:hypothetical protein
MAEELRAKLTPVTSTMDQESVDVEADAIGFVFPIYDFKPPPVIDEFVPKLEDIGSKYLFAVCTYGIAPAPRHEALQYDEAEVTHSRFGTLGEPG